MRKLRSTVLALLIACLTAPATADAPAALQAQASSFLTAIKQGNGSAAVDGIMRSSPLWSKKPGAREAMLGQIDAAIQAYGPVSSFELLSSQALGTMVVKQLYLVQHRDNVTRWEFDFTRATSGWQVAYFGFNDQTQTWFDQ